MTIKESLISSTLMKNSRLKKYHFVIIITQILYIIRSISLKALRSKKYTMLMIRVLILINLKVKHYSILDQWGDFNSLSQLIQHSEWVIQWAHGIIISKCPLRNMSLKEVYLNLRRESQVFLKIAELIFYRNMYQRVRKNPRW